MSQLAHLVESLRGASKAALPGGTSILRLIDWDTYALYREIGSKIDYRWESEVVLHGFDDSAVRVKQTINLLGMGTHRKHETSFAFEFRDLMEATVVEYPGRFPLGETILWKTYESPPWGVHLEFKVPVRINRWSGLPITSEPLNQEISVFEISLWWGRIEAAKRVALAFSQLRDLANTQETTTQNLGTPASANTTPTSLGGISRL